MIFTRVRLFAFGGRVGSGVANAQRTWTERRGILLQLRAIDGAMGLGEATPLPGYSPDELTAAQSVLEQMGPDLVSERWPRDVAALEEKLARKLEVLPRSPSAELAIATALGDVAGKQRDVPLAAIWGGEGRRASGVARSVLSGIAGDPRAIARAATNVRRGAQQLKFKARGDDPEAEARFVETLRQTLEREVDVLLDLNGSLSVDAARYAIDRYARAGVVAVEEPCRGPALFELGTCALPWFVDESLQDRALRRELLEADGCGGVVLKPTVLGLFASLAIGRDARARGLAVSASHCFEGPIALAATCALGLSLGEGPGLAGIDRHDALAAFPEAEIASLREEAPLSVRWSPSPGLGLAFEPGAQLVELGRWTR
jgi:L-alanine-DL-glutamate epimerase-like enolase superfamily enzyme